MRNLVLAAVAVLPLTGCNLVIPLDVEHELEVSAPAGPFSVAEPVDLTEDEDVWSERDRIESVEVKRVEATVVAVGAANRASQANAVLRFRADGAPADGSADVPVATLSAVAIAAGATTAATDTGALDEALNGALRGSGRFTILFDGDVDDVLDATVRISIAADVKVKAD